MIPYCYYVVRTEKLEDVNRPISQKIVLEIDLERNKTLIKA